MTQFVTDYYLWIKAVHIIAVISWMAGMFYLPRLYVYHVKATAEQAQLLMVMEKKLLRIIINPAMIASFIFGILLVYFYIANDAFKTAGWLHTKILLVLAMGGIHGFLSSARKKFERGANTRSEKFWRMFNEVPVVLMIIIVILAVVKPF